jgi:hypothetical protein
LRWDALLFSELQDIEGFRIPEGMAGEPRSLHLRKPSDFENKDYARLARQKLMKLSLSIIWSIRDPQVYNGSEKGSNESAPDSDDKSDEKPDIEETDSETESEPSDRPGESGNWYGESRVQDFHGSHTLDHDPVRVHMSVDMLAPLATNLTVSERLLQSYFLAITILHELCVSLAVCCIIP